MNNSSITLDNIEPVVDVLPRLREEESRVLKVIESLRKVRESNEWSTLKNELFDGLVNSLEKDLRAEARKDDPDPKRLNKLSGELKWAEKFSDLSKLENTYLLQLQRIRTQQNGNTE